MAASDGASGQSEAWHTPPVVSDVSEADLVQVVVDETSCDTAVVGIGDDAAVLAAAGSLAVTTDCMVENLDFRLDWSTPEDIGVKAVVQNVADVVAMGATPTALVMTAVLPRNISVDWFRRFCRGIQHGCDTHGVQLVGGDLSGGPAIMVNITALGELHQPPITRAGAQPGDKCYVVGHWGNSHVVLQHLLDGKLPQDFPSPVLRWHTRPEPRLSAAVQQRLRSAHAAIDISDGLLRDAGRVAQASGVRIALDSHHLVMQESSLTWEFARHAMTCNHKFVADAIRRGGEDHSLFVVMPADEQVPDDWFYVGVVQEATTSEPAAVVIVGETYDGPDGWDHFED